MPFTKTNGKYKSPSGKTFTQKQVNLYYASKGTFRKTAKSQQTRQARGNRAKGK